MPSICRFQLTPPTPDWCRVDSVREDPSGQGTAPRRCTRLEKSGMPCPTMTLTNYTPHPLESSWVIPRPDSSHHLGIYWHHHLGSPLLPGPHALFPFGRAHPAAYTPLHQNTRISLDVGLQAGLTTSEMPRSAPPLIAETHISFQGHQDLLQTIPDLRGRLVSWSPFHSPSDY